MEACRIVERETDHLPPNELITQIFSKRKGRIIHIDGKFVKVKGYEKKIPFIYAIDYFTHDIPVGVLSLGENYESYLKLFRILKDIGYDPKVVVSDEASSLPPALERVFPSTFHQLCLTHYVENIRVLLKIRTESKYRSFFFELEKIFKRGIDIKQRYFVLEGLEEKYPKDIFIKTVIDDIYDKYHKLFLFENYPNCPHSNNIIEAFNSHLNGRLKTIKGFKSFLGAERWLNAWMIRRRTKPFTDCEKPFLHLNGKCSLEEVIDLNEKFEEIYLEITKKVIDLDRRKWRKKHQK